MGSFESNEINSENINIKKSGKVRSIEKSFDEGGNVLFPLKELHKSMNIEVNRRSSFTFYRIVLS